MIRYKDKPLLRLLECYVLDAMGALAPDDARKLETLEPKLGSVYNRSGSWREILAAEMDFPAHMEERIIQIWAENQQAATAHGVRLSPQQFAEMFVDQNFGPELEDPGADSRRSVISDGR